MKRRRALLIADRQKRRDALTFRQLRQQVASAHHGRESAERKCEQVQRRLQDITPVYLAMKRLEEYRYGGRTYAITMTWNMDAVCNTLLARNPLHHPAIASVTDLSCEVAHMAHDVEEKFRHGVMEEIGKELTACRIA